MTAPNIPTIVDPTFGEAGPSTAELAGHLIAVIPTQINHEAPGFEPGTKTTTVTADVYVIDGGVRQLGTLVYGAAPKQSRPANMQIQTPALFRGQFFSQVNMVRAMAQYVGQGKAVLGIVTQSNVGQRPWNLEALDANDPRRALIAEFFGALAAGTYTLPTGTPLAGVAQAPAQPQYMPAQQSYAQAQPSPQYANTIPQAQQQPQMPPPMAAPQPQAIAQIFQPQPAVDAVPPQLAATGMTPEFWATLAQPQRDMMLQMAAQAAAPTQQPINTY